MLFRNILAQSQRAVSVSLSGVSSARIQFTSWSSLTLTNHSSFLLFFPVCVRSRYSCASFKLQTHSYSNTKMPAESSIIYLRYVKLTPNAHSPSKGSEKAAGFDLKSAYDYVIQPRSKEMVKTDLQIMLPDGCYGRIAPRSGLAWKNSIDVGAGVVDEDYRGDVKVILFNHSDDAFSIQAGDRIAQLICERIYYPQLQEVEKLNETDRGSAGFGSTGKS